MGLAYALGDAALDSTLISMKKGNGTGILGKIGGGLVKGAGSLAMGTADLTGKVAINGSKFIGDGLINSFNRNPVAVTGSILGGAAIGGILADQDKQTDPRTAAVKGGLIGSGAIAVGEAAFGLGTGMATLGTGFGVAALGAGVMGASAFGTVGRGMIRPITKGEKYNKMVKENEKDISREAHLPQAKKKVKRLTDEDFLKAGAEKGSKEAINNIRFSNLQEDFKLGKMAIPLILGTSLIKGLAGGARAFEKSRMGVNDGMMRNATPNLPTVDQTQISQLGNPTHISGSYYANNAGATGDLVFAMHKNR